MTPAYIKREKLYRSALDMIAKLAWHSENDGKPTLSNEDRWRIVAICRDTLTLPESK